MIRKEKRYDVWFRSDPKHTRMVVYYHGKSLLHVQARALARTLNRKRGYKAIVLPHGKAPPEHQSVPRYKYRVGDTVRAGSHGVGVVESRQRNFDWAGADDLYRVRVGQTLHLLGEKQLRRVASQFRRTTPARRRDPILTDGRGVPIEKPLKKDYASEEAWMRAYFKYQDRKSGYGSDEFNKAFVKALRKPKSRRDPNTKRHVVRGPKKTGTWYVTVYDGWLGGNTVIAQNFATKAAAEKWARAHTKKTFKTWQFTSRYV